MNDYQFKFSLCNLITVVAIIFLIAAPRALAEETKDQKDISELRAGAEKGNAEDQCNLGGAYFKGDGVPKNVVEAVKWWLKSADQGHAVSQSQLGFIYYDGDEGVPKDCAEALKWNNKAAAQGNPDSLAMLGDAYSEGCGVPIDNVKAYAWYNLALAAGDKFAGEAMNLLGQEMTQAQIAKAQLLARGWQAHIKPPEIEGGRKRVDVAEFQKKPEESIQNAGAPDVPTLDARTASSGKETLKSSEGNIQEEQVVRSLAVAVGLRSSKTPSQPYDVQCFFIGRSELTKENFLYNVQHQASSLATDALTFQAPSIEGSNTKKYSIPVSGDFTGATIGGESVSGSFSGTSSSTQKTKGDRFYGWVVRVVSKGTVVRMASNQASLKTLAEKNPTFFDQAAASK